MEGGLLLASWCCKELQRWENVEVRRPRPITPGSSQLSHNPIRFCWRVTQRHHGGLKTLSRTPLRPKAVPKVSLCHYLRPSLRRPTICKNWPGAFQ